MNFSVAKYEDLVVKKLEVNIGILAGISNILAQNGIGIFVVSTFNTDYVLVKKENFDEALQVLERKDHTIMK